MDEHKRVFSEICATHYGRVARSKTISRKFGEKIIDYLLSPTGKESAKLRFFVKTKGLRVCSFPLLGLENALCIPRKQKTTKNASQNTLETSSTEAKDDGDVDDMPMYKRLVYAEHFYDILIRFHIVDGVHIGTKRTLMAVYNRYAGIPRSAVERFVQTCPGCCYRRGRGKATVHSPDEVDEEEVDDQDEEDEGEDVAEDIAKRPAAPRNAGPGKHVKAGEDCLQTPPGSQSTSGDDGSDNIPGSSRGAAKDSSNMDVEHGNGTELLQFYSASAPLYASERSPISPTINIMIQTPELSPDEDGLELPITSRTNECAKRASHNKWPRRYKSPTPQQALRWQPYDIDHAARPPSPPSPTVEVVFVPQDRSWSPAEWLDAGTRGAARHRRKSRMPRRLPNWNAVA